jgi:hypothetical protein
MSNRFKSIDFIDFYIAKLAKPVAPIADGFLQITYVDGLYIGDSPRKIAELFMYPNNTNFYNESDYVYELISGEGDEDNSDLYIVGRELFSSVPLKNFEFRIGARHTSGYVEERDELKIYYPEPTMFFNIDTSTTTGAETAADEFKIPTVYGNAYDIVVYWGDGSLSEITSHDQSNRTHTYSTAGTYQIGIAFRTSAGDLAFNGSGDAVKVTELTAWGDVHMSAGMFDGCTNLVITATDAPVIGVTMERVFKDCSSIVTVPGMNNWDVTGVYNFDYTFEGATLFNQNLLQ